MNFNNVSCASTGYSSVSRKDFDLKSERACVFGRKNKDKYMAYQDEYRARFGVFPELDKINNPFIAPWSDAYELYKGLQKRGFDGAWFYHDLHGFFNKRLKKMYNEYQPEWSFMMSIDIEYRNLVEEIAALSPGDRIVNGLGSRKEQNGNYYEGTWINGALVYGLLYFAESGALVVGSISDGNIIRGACLIKEATKNQAECRLLMGIFKETANFCRLYDSSCLSINITKKVRNGEAIGDGEIEATVGQFEDGYEQGRFYQKSFSDNIRIGWGDYKDGEIKRSFKLGFNVIPRLYIAIVMMPYFMIKYTYGLLIFPIYRAIQKKNWR